MFPEYEQKPNDEGYDVPTLKYAADQPVDQTLPLVAPENETEECCGAGTTVTVPTAMFELPELSSILNMET